MIKNIIKSLDKWVSTNGNGKYYPDNYIEKKEENLILEEFYGIQQNRKEILSLLKILLKKKQRKICLEIGIGHMGSTHFLFRHIFKKTITIELDKHRVFSFADRLTKFYKKHIISDGKSHFIYGSSSNPTSVSKVANFLKNEKLDFLFIDGSHYFQDVLTDWLIYKNFVSKNGIIAFHDCNNKINNNGGVPKLINFIKKNFKIKIKKIIFNKFMGIAYYEV